MAPKKGAKKGTKRAAKKAAKGTDSGAGGPTQAQIVDQVASLTFWVRMLKLKVGWGLAEPQDAIDDVGRPTGGAHSPPPFP